MFLLAPTASVCTICNLARLSNGSNIADVGTSRKLPKYITHPTIYATISGIDYSEFRNEEQVFIFHPRSQHLSSSFAKEVSFLSHDRILVKTNTYDDPPAPYTDCENVVEERNRELNFFADQFEYNENHCQLSCKQTHFLLKNNHCNGDIP